MNDILKDDKYKDAIKNLMSLSKNDQIILEKALLLVKAVTNSVEKGIKHFNKAGVLRTTPEEVLKTLRDEGAIRLDTSQEKKDGNSVEPAG